MKIHIKEITVSTNKREDLVNITKNVEDIVKESSVKNGIVLIFVPHATAAIYLNEDEYGLRQDIISKALQLFPRGAGYLHDRIDDNANAHLASSFIGQMRILPVINGRLVRGTWQEIFLLDMDGPRTRRVIIEVLGE